MLNRRRFLAGSAVTLAGARWLQAVPPNRATGAPQVHTPCGSLEGERLPDDVRLFRGVPFAQPPVGPLRFRPPVSLPRWSGVRAAKTFAAAAVQPGEPKVAQSEDCLYLNVWAPVEDGSYPVFVWVHGGGFTGGNSFDPLFDGSKFARDGVICVTVGYRLGVLGFLDVEPILGPAYAGSANNGLRDVVAALAWVQRNIAAFGGDPKRVTLGGESAGAKLTDLLLAAPAAKNLFYGAISESGGADRVFARTRSQEVGADFGKAWTAATQQAAASIATADSRELMRVQESFTKSYPVHFPLRAEIDGTFLSAPPLGTIRAGSTRGKRLLLGTNRDESALFLGPDPQADPTAGDLGNMTLAAFQPIEGKYAELYPEMAPAQRRIRSVTAEEYWVPSIRVVDAHVAAGGEAFVYRFDWSAKSGRFAGLAFHSEELKFVWEHFAEPEAAGELERLAETVHAAWVAFLKGGAPAAPGLPAWPRYSVPQRPTMLLDNVSRVADAPAAAEFALWDGKLE